MNTDLSILSALCVLFMGLSAFFAGAETALFSIPRERIDTYQNHAKPSRRRIYSLLIDGQRTLLFLLLCNLFINITLTGLIHSLVSLFLGASSPLWSFLAATLIIITFGEVLPKFYALRFNESLAAFVAPILCAGKRVTSPLLNVIRRANSFFLEYSRGHIRKPSPFVTLDELKSAVRKSRERRIISKSEERIVESLLDRGAMPVTRFMIHRTHAVFLPHYATVSSALDALMEKSQTHAVITKDAGGHQVIGTLHISDLLGAPPAERCRRFIKPVHWVPSTHETADLISFMFAQNLSVVCVLDEFGGVGGIFTLSAGLDGAVNVKHEREQNKRASFESAKVFAGTTEIEEMASWLPKTLLEKHPNVRTLNGILTRHLGRIPKAGESFDIDGQNFYIIHSDPTRICNIMLHKRDA